LPGRFPIRSASATRSGLLGCLAICLLAPAAAARDRGADGEFEKRTSSHFVLLQDVDIDESSGLRGSRRFEQQVLETLEKAYDRLGESLGLRPPRPITVMVYDPGLFDAQFAPLFRFNVAGFYRGTVHVRGGTRMSDRLVRVLHHELVHAAFDAAAPSLVLPAWFNEGVSEWFEARSVGQHGLRPREHQMLANAANSGRLFSLGQLSRPNLGGFDSNAAHLAYVQSFAFIDFLSVRQGDRALRDLCREVVRTQNLERAVQKTQRQSLPRLEQQFRESLQ
jgi:hypothetical protein